MKDIGLLSNPKADRDGNVSGPSRLLARPPNAAAKPELSRSKSMGYLGVLLFKALSCLASFSPCLSSSSRTASFDSSRLFTSDTSCFSAFLIALCPSKLPKFCAVDETTHRPPIISNPVENF